MRCYHCSQPQVLHFCSVNVFRLGHFWSEQTFDYLELRIQFSTALLFQKLSNCQWHLLPIIWMDIRYQV